jgi:uncharacterized lipoprotein
VETYTAPVSDAELEIGGRLVAVRSPANDDGDPCDAIAGMRVSYDGDTCTVTTPDGAAVPSTWSPVGGP